MQQSGTEWLYRMYQEPRRLFRRYAMDLWHFGREIPAQWWNLKSTRNPKFSSSYSSTVWKSKWRHIRAPQRLDADIARRGNLLWKHAAEHHLLFDLADVHTIDSTGVGLLLQLRKKARAEGRRLVLLSPSEAVQRALKFMRVQHLFAIAETTAHQRFMEVA
jgi:anti-anti-sigma factor